MEATGADTWDWELFSLTSNQEAISRMINQTHTSAQAGQRSWFYVLEIRFYVPALMSRGVSAHQWPPPVSEADIAIVQIPNDGLLYNQAGQWKNWFYISTTKQVFPRRWTCLSATCKHHPKATRQTRTHAMIFKLFSSIPIPGVFAAWQNGGASFFQLAGRPLSSSSLTLTRKVH